MTMEDAASARKALARLQEDAILKSLGNHNFPFRAHVLRPAAVQQDFHPAGFSLHPLTKSPATAVIQRFCRRMLVLGNLGNFGTPALLHRQQQLTGTDQYTQQHPSTQSLEPEAFIYQKSGSGYAPVTTQREREDQKRKALLGPNRDVQGCVQAREGQAVIWESFKSSMFSSTVKPMNHVTDDRGTGARLEANLESLDLDDSRAIAKIRRQVWGFGFRFRGCGLGCSFEGRNCKVPPFSIPPSLPPSLRFLFSPSPVSSAPVCLYACARPS